jgi:hypothetical protein
MNTKVYPVMDDFSLTSGGIFYKLGSRLGLGGISSKHITIRIIILIAITWLPLLALTAMQGLAIGNKVEIPFWKDFAIHSKFLIILPLLIFAEGPFDFKLKELTLQFFKSGILDEKDLLQYEEIKKKVKGLVDSIWPDVFIIIFIVLNLLFRFISVGSSQISIWIFLPDNMFSSISWGGIYLAIICGPFFQFFLIRWL